MWVGASAYLWVGEQPYDLCLSPMEIQRGLETSPSAHRTSSALSRRQKRTVAGTFLALQFRLPTHRGDSCDAIPFQYLPFANSSRL